MLKIFLSFFLPVMLGLSLAGSASAQTKPLALKVFSAEESGFFVSSVLVTGKTEAVLFDAQFSRANALRVAALALDSGKKLTRIYISQGDPDYYFGIEAIKEQFPDVKVFASAETVKHIRETLKNKLN